MSHNRHYSSLFHSHGNQTASTCDAAKNRCICGSIGFSSEGCPSNEVCSDESCMCGSNPGCERDSNNAYCDSFNGLCTSDPCISVECTVVGETCQSGVCKCGNGVTCEGNVNAPLCDSENDQCVTAGINNFPNSLFKRSIIYTVGLIYVLFLLYL